MQHLQSIERMSTEDLERVLVEDYAQALEQELAAENTAAREEEFVDEMEMYLRGAKEYAAGRTYEIRHIAELMMGPEVAHKIPDKAKAKLRAREDAALAFSDSAAKARAKRAAMKNADVIH